MSLSPKPRKKSSGSFFSLEYSSSVQPCTERADPGARPFCLSVCGFSGRACKCAGVFGGIEDPPPPSTKRSFILRPISETTSSGWHPAKQCRSSLPFSALILRQGFLLSSCAGQKHIAFSPLRLATLSLSSTSSKSANILGVSFEQVGAWLQAPTT